MKGNLHVPFLGGLAGAIPPGYPAAGWVTIGSTRQRTAHSVGFFPCAGVGICGPPLSGGVGLLKCHFRTYQVLQTLPDQYHRPLMGPVHQNSVMSYVANRHSTRNKRRCRVDY